GCGITYHPGDSLGVCPRNPDPLVEAILERLGATGDEPVSASHAAIVSFREGLSFHWDLANPSRRLFEACLAQGAEMFGPLLAKGGEGQLKHYIHPWDDLHDLLDVLHHAPG